MIEKIKKIYNDKSEYYIDILNKIKDDDIDFVMLNYIIPDDNPGDMDILINGYDKLSVQNILTIAILLSLSARTVQFKSNNN